MSKMSIIHATAKLKLQGILSYYNVLKQFFVLRLPHIIDIISIIDPKMSKMSIMRDMIRFLLVPKVITDEPTETSARVSALL